MENTQQSVGSIIFMILGVGIAALVLIFISVLGGATYTQTEADIDLIGVTPVSNEAFTALNNSWVSLAHSPMVDGTYTIYNATGSTNTTDFTVNLTDATLIIAGTGDQNLNNTACTITYEYGNATIRTYVREGIVSSFLALRQTGSYLPIVVLAVIITIILGLIVGLTGTRPGGGGYGYSGAL